MILGLANLSLRNHIVYSIRTISRKIAISPAYTRQKNEEIKGKLERNKKIVKKKLATLQFYWYYISRWALSSDVYLGLAELASRNFFPKTGEFVDKMCYNCSRKARKNNKNNSSDSRRFSCYVEKTI